MEEMNEMRENPLLHEELTGRILEACFEVSNELRCGFLESVYLNALALCLEHKGMAAEKQVPLEVRFRDNVVGQFFADMVVEGKVIVELKAVKTLAPEHFAQVINYLNGTGVEIGLLVNFGQPKLEHRRLERRASPFAPSRASHSSMFEQE